MLATPSLFPTTKGHAVTDEEYLNQTQYFSESQQAFVDIETMPPPYALNAMRKLQQEFGSRFRDSPLWNAFFIYLRPGNQEILMRLKQRGVVSFYAVSPAERSRVRRVMYRAGARLGVKVKTRTKNSMVTGEVVSSFTVRVRGEEVT